MASTYSTNLALELIGTGEQSGTWGTTTNTNLGTLLEQAISGYVTQAITDGSGANTTITIPNGTTGVARNMFIEMTGALSFSTTSLIVPANKKMYFVFNNTSGGFAVTVKVSGQTGILVPNGKKVILTCNGTDIVEAHTAIVGNATIGGTLGVTGVTTLGNGAILGTPASGTVTNLTGTASININGTVGATTPAAGAFTTLSANNLIRGTYFDSAVIYGGADNDNFTAVYGTSHPSLANQWEVTLDGANRARITTTGLAVTGTLSATGYLGVAGGGTTTAVAEFGGTMPAISSAAKEYHFLHADGPLLVLGKDATNYSYFQHDVAATTSKWVMRGNVNFATLSSTGLAVTGALSATGTLSGGTSGTGYSFSGSAPANSLTLDASGNLGIGYTSPQARLDVRASNIAIGVTALATAQGQAFVGTTTGWGQDIGGTLALGGAQNSSTLTQTFASISGRRESSLGYIYTGYLQLAVSDGANMVERARIDSSGNLGIGTASPQARVTINQSMNIYGGATFAASAATGQGLNFGYDGNTEQSWIQALRNNTSELRTLQLNPLGGTVTTGAALTVGGALSKASGSFRISHPLPALTETHELVHSFIEGPQADLIYRGKVNLIAGKASVNIDTAARMTEGTFVVLCREVQCFTTNESGWNHVRGSVVGNVLTIDCQDQTAADLVSWMVIGERQDPHMYETYWTDENGKVIVEPLKPQVIPVTQDALGVTDVTEDVMQ